jgi:hypothetical protein
VRVFGVAPQVVRFPRLFPWGSSGLVAKPSRESTGTQVPTSEFRSVTLR